MRGEALARPRAARRSWPAAPVATSGTARTLRWTPTCPPPRRRHGGGRPTALRSEKQRSRKVLLDKPPRGGVASLAQGREIRRSDGAAFQGEVLHDAARHETNSRLNHCCRRGSDFPSRGRGKPSVRLLRKLLRTGHGSACRSQTRSLRCHSPCFRSPHRARTSEHGVDPLEQACCGARVGERQSAHRPPETAAPLRPIWGVQGVLADVDRRP